jgi:acyl-[acyl-carrier-protein]-phospholipid O-acyltransferase/long-chain-fatty-acid--[acyl-carrier-protein] ligase
VEHQVFSVTAVADDRKGESLAVIHTHDEAEIPEILKKLGDMGLPNLFIPRKDRFLRVDELPLLGTGKINLKEARRIATEHFE